MCTAYSLFIWGPGSFQRKQGGMCSNHESLCVCVCVCVCVRKRERERERERERNSRLLPLRSHFHIVKMLKMLFCYEKQLVHVFIRIMGIS